MIFIIIIPSKNAYGNDEEIKYRLKSSETATCSFFMKTILGFFSCFWLFSLEQYNMRFFQLE